LVLSILDFRKMAKLQEPTGKPVGGRAKKKGNFSGPLILVFLSTPCFDWGNQALLIRLQTASTCLGGKNNANARLLPVEGVAECQILLRNPLSAKDLRKLKKLLLVL
jgi:hypothetical protein